MIKQQLIYLITTCAVLVGLLLGISYLFRGQPSIFGPFDPNNVRGSAVEVERGLYTLNFEQQNHLLAALSEATLEPNPTNPLPSQPPATFLKAVIYRFDGGDIEIYPNNHIRGQLLFSTSDHKGNSSYYLERRSGELESLLEPICR